MLGLAACSSGNTTAPTAADVETSGVEEIFNVSSLARTFTEGFAFRGVTITPDQADCMAKHFVNEFTPDEAMQLALDSEYATPNPADLDRGADAIIGCLPADVIAAIANRKASSASLPLRLSLLGERLETLARVLELRGDREQGV